MSVGFCIAIDRFDDFQRSIGVDPTWENQTDCYTELYKGEQYFSYTGEIYRGRISSWASARE